MSYDIKYCIILILLLPVDQSIERFFNFKTVHDDITNF